MVEYMDREAAIKAIYESDHFSVNECFGWRAREIEEVLRAVPVTPVPQWISVKDRMPNDEKLVLLLRKNGKVSRAEVRKIGAVVRFRLYSEEDDYSPVTHWAAFPAMPLPEAPKGGTENE